MGIIPMSNLVPIHLPFLDYNISLLTPMSHLNPIQSISHPLPPRPDPQTPRVRMRNPYCPLVLNPSPSIAILLHQSIGIFNRGQLIRRSFIGKYRNMRNPMLAHDTQFLDHSPRHSV